MNNLVTTIVICLSLLLTMTCILLGNSRKDVREKEMCISSLYGELNKVNDEIYDNNYNIKIIDSLNVVINNKTHLCDSLKEELDVANFKLKRIEYYNDIAAKNNNIKFLRGWINRVLDN